MVKEGFMIILSACCDRLKLFLIAFCDRTKIFGFFSKLVHYTITYTNT